MIGKKLPHIFFGIDDPFPPWRLDIDELFAHQLAAKGVRILWAAKRNGIGACEEVLYLGQRALLPSGIASGGIARRLINEFLQLIFELGLFFRLLGEKVDLIQIRDRRYFLGVLVWLAARIKGIPFVYWLSYPYPEHILEMARQETGWRHIFLRVQGGLTSLILYRFLLRRADHVFVQSEQMRQDIAEYGIDPDKMMPVPMGVPPKLLTWVAQKEIGQGVSGRIVYVGTLARIRKLQTLIDAFVLVHKRFDTSHLVIVGDGDRPEDKACLVAMVRDYGLENAVTFTGFVPMEDAWSWAASAEVCISPFYPTPTLNSASPTKLVEYLALGKPVVANEHPDQALVLEQSLAGVCVPWGAESFAEGICGFLADPQKASRVGALGPAWVAKHRSYDILATQVLDKYQEILGR